MLLQTEEGELSLLVSAAAKPVRPHAEGSHHGWARLGLGLGLGLGLLLTLTLTLTVTVTVTLTLTRCDRYWGNTQNCRMPTAPQDMPLPFRCSQDALFEVTLVGVRVLGLGLGLGLANPNPNPLQGQAVEP